jgi:hypothetical protein
VTETAVADQTNLLRKQTASKGSSTRSTSPPARRAPRPQRQPRPSCAR